MQFLAAQPYYTNQEIDMYGWHSTVYKVWAYFILTYLFPLIVFERIIGCLIESIHNGNVLQTWIVCIVNAMRM